MKLKHYLQKPVSGHYGWEGWSWIVDVVLQRYSWFLHNSHFEYHSHPSFELITCYWIPHGPITRGSLIHSSAERTNWFAPLSDSK